MWQCLVTLLQVTFPPTSGLGQDETKWGGRGGCHLALPTSANTTQHEVALHSSSCSSVLLPDLPKPCKELTWFYILHLLPEQTLVKVSHILSQSVPLKRELMLGYISLLRSKVFTKFLPNFSIKFLPNTSIYLKDQPKMANKKVSSPYLELTRTFQAVALFLAHSSVFTWWFITHSYIRFPYI